MKKILVTAFEPFGGRRENPALDVLAGLRAASFGQSRLFKARLPVSGRAVGAKISALLSRIKPDLLVCLGLAAGETGLRLERLGVNILDYSIKDNSGFRPEGKKIRPEGPAAYFVTTDPRKMATAARAAGVPAYVSNHAGAYVCNTLMYEALRAISAAGRGTGFAFIHLPFTTEIVLKDPPGRQVPPSLPAALLVKAVTAAIKAA
ncbi:MAG: hypothetical protein NDI60_04535 [Elusimicrobiales bacterium]|nr:hypothetical protein [Elusimicrobiales bacterium]